MIQFFGKFFLVILCLLERGREGGRTSKCHFRHTFIVHILLNLIVLLVWLNGFVSCIAV
jgi:hypothetical protein